AGPGKLGSCEVHARDWNLWDVSLPEGNLRGLKERLKSVRGDLTHFSQTYTALLIAQNEFQTPRVYAVILQLLDQSFKVSDQPGKETLGAGGSFSETPAPRDHLVRRPRRMERLH